MRRYVTISTGRCASEAIPVVSSSDPEVVEAALLAIQDQLKTKSSARQRPAEGEADS